MQYKHVRDQTYSSEYINKNHIFSLLFFESWYLIYYHAPKFVTLESCR